MALMKTRLSLATPPWPPGRPGKRPSILDQFSSEISWRPILQSPALPRIRRGIYQIAPVQSTRPRAATVTETTPVAAACPAAIKLAALIVFDTTNAGTPADATFCD